MMNSNAFSEQLSNFIRNTFSKCVFLNLIISSSMCFRPHYNRLFTVFIVILIFLLCNACSPVSGSTLSRHTVATIPGDLVLGALFPVHQTPGPRQAQLRICGDVREQYGIHRVEAAFLAIDSINKDNSILPNITLGIEIRDSCWYSPIALEQSIEFIRDAMAASEDSNDFQVKTTAKAGMQAIPTASISHSPLFPLLKTPFHLGSHFNTSGMCPRTAKKVKNLVGVIGPASSTVTIQVQNLLQLFNIPQIGYSATSRDLSEKNYYKSFLRVVPSDFYQAKVMIDLFLSNNWTYVSVLYTDGNYGSSLMEVFKGLAQEARICIANTESMNYNAEDVEVDEVFKSLQQYSSTAKVVACFCEGMTVRSILKAIRRWNATGELVLVGSDGWSDRPDVVEGYEHEAVGGLSVRIHSPYVPEFDPYYFNLNPENNTRNPWFQEFWEWKFNCTLPFKKTALEGNKLPTFAVYNKTCSGKESLAEKHKQDTKMAFVMKAIYTMAYGLHSMQKAMCPHTKGLCPDMLPINGSILLQHLFNVSFVWGNDTVEFDNNGDPPGRYDIMNFQRIGHNEYNYMHIGSWDSTGNITIFSGYQWPSSHGGNDSAPPESVCSRPCSKGYAKNIQSESVKCCWVCVPCHENQYLEDEYKCKNCSLGWWPNDNLTGCNRILIEYIHWTETSSLVAMGIAIIGAMMTLMTMVVFIRHNNTPIVKASTRELSYMIMIGMFLCYGTTFALIAKPTKWTCTATQILPGFSFAVIYASLVTKTNRIARILAGSKKRIITKKPRFMSSGAQVAISLTLISIESGIIGTILVKNPADSKLHYPTLNKVLLICNTDPIGIIAPLGFDFFLIAMCTVYAVKTRNVPENFNEAKFIGFTMYTTLVIWIAFVPIYFGSDLKILTMCLCISFSAIVALILLFFPKVYIIIFKPEKNNRSYFTTAKNVRCHIGYVPTVGISRHSSHSTSEFSVDSPRNHSLELYNHHLPAHLKKSPSDKGNAHFIHDKSSSSSATIAKGVTKPRRRNFNIFERLRLNKQDKIAANVQRKIRAVRAAEALDRQTNRRGRVAVRTVASSGVEISEVESSDSQRMRLITFLRQTYGEDVNKIPGFLDLSESMKDGRKKSYVEAYAQTSYDLLETWFPAVKNKLQKIEAISNESREHDSKSNSTTSLHQKMREPQTLAVEDLRVNFYDSGSKQISPHKSNLSSHICSTARSSGSSKINNHFNRNVPEASTALPIGVSTQTPPQKRRSNLVSSSAKARSSEESLLSASGSCVIEESASSGGDSSPSSGVVYKNIIISLGENAVTADTKEQRTSSQLRKRV